LACASVNEVAKKAFVEPDEAEEEEIDDEALDEAESELDEEEEEGPMHYATQQLPNPKRVKVECPPSKKQLLPPSTFSYGIMYELNAPELHTYFIFISRCDGLEVKVTRPEGTTNMIHLELNYTIPLAVVNDLATETGYSIAYLQAHNPSRTFIKTIKLPFTINEFTAKVISDAHTIVIRIVGQEKL
jgi:hypothetical protein